MNEPTGEAIPLTAHQAHMAIHHLFGESAVIEVRSRYLIKVNGKLLGDGATLVLSIASAVQTHCEKTGEDANELFARALAAYRQNRPTPPAETAAFVVHGIDFESCDTQPARCHRAETAAPLRRVS